MTSYPLPAVGDVFFVPYPFVRCKWNEIELEGPIERDGWNPGTEYIGSDDNGNVYANADAMGSMALTVVSVHKPGKYPARIFFTRRFTDPEGHEFGKGKLHIVTFEKFRRLAMGYQHPFHLAKAEASSHA